MAHTHYPIPRRWPWSWLMPRCHCGADSYRRCIRLMEAARRRREAAGYVEPKSFWGDEPKSRPGRHWY